MKQESVQKQMLVVGVIIALAVAIASGLWLTKKTVARSEQVNRVITVETVSLQKNANKPVLSMYGYVVVPKALEISSKLTGQVEQITIQAGKRVVKGQLLIQIDTSDYDKIVLEGQAEYQGVVAQIDGEKAALAINQLALEQEQVLLSLSEKRYERQKRLADQGAVTEVALETSQREVEQHRLQVTQRTGLLAQHVSTIEILQAKLQALAIQIERARDDVDQTSIYAPCDGVVSEINIAEGSRVDQKLLVRIIPDGAYEVRAQVPTKHIEGVRESLASNSLVQGYVVMGDQTVPITLDRLLPVVSDGQMGQQAVFLFDESRQSEMFAHNMPVFIRMQLPAIEDSYQIAATAIYPNNTIYVLDDSGHLKAVEVQKLGYADGPEQQSTIIVTSNEIIEEKEVMVTHIPHPAEGLEVQKYSTDQA